jgi:hypothetical protein
MILLEIGPKTSGELRNEQGSAMISEDSIFINNTPRDYDGGGIVNLGTITVKRSTIKNDNAEEEGGGIDTDEHGVLTLEDSIVSNNRVEETGGRICSYSLLHLYNTTITNNTTADGGGIYVDYECM